MIKNTVFLLVCLFAVSLFSSCEKEECFEDHDENEIAASALLTNGVWDLQMVHYREFYEGEPIAPRNDFYGPGTENGECTFEFGHDFKYVMIDDGNKETYRFSYLPQNRIVLDGDTYMVEVLTEDALELVIFYGDGDCSDEIDEGNGTEEHMYFGR